MLVYWGARECERGKSTYPVLPGTILVEEELTSRGLSRAVTLGKVVDDDGNKKLLATEDLLAVLLSLCQGGDELLLNGGNVVEPNEGGVLGSLHGLFGKVGESSVLELSGL